MKGIRNSFLKYQGGIYRSYGPVKKCIYCDSSVFNEKRKKLSDEHVVPRSLDGQITLLEASCEACMRVTNSFENKLVNGIFNPIRCKLKMKRRNRGSKSSRYGDEIEIFVDGLDGPKRMSIPLECHPLSLELPIFHQCVALGGAGGQSDSVIIWDMEAISKFGNRYGAVSLITSLWNMQDFLRFIAKVGHSYTVAKLGLNFTPLLLDMIHGRSLDFFNFIGGSLEGVGLQGRSLWELIPAFKVVEGRFYFVVKFGLFGIHGGPTYEIVTGIIDKPFDLKNFK